MSVRASIAAAVLGALALLGSFALPARVATHHAQAMNCEAHHDCAPVSVVCVSDCLDALKQEGTATAVSATVLAAVVTFVGMLVGWVPAFFARVFPPVVPIPIRSSDIRVTRKRLD